MPLGPQAQRNGHVPTMGSDEFASVVQGMAEYVAWYKCPKGHVYTVGNCTRPMEASSATARTFLPPVPPHTTPGTLSTRYQNEV